MKRGIKVAVLSGKGGTGKTLVSVNLASVARESIYIDCDVEEPNGHLFFKPDNIREEDVAVAIPVIDETLCDGCRKCVDFCKFNALAFFQNKPFVFEEVCHACGGCALLCPQKAISEKWKVIGKVQRGLSRKVHVHSGILRIGEASGIPIVKNLLRGVKAYSELPIFIDCPPGSACIVMESIKDADFCVLVAEPTIFGVHNLSMVFDLVKLFDKPHGVVLNKCLDGENPSEQFCLKNGIPVLCRIPYDTQLGLLNSDARIAARESDRYRTLFSSLFATIMKEAQHEAVVDP